MASFERNQAPIKALRIGWQRILKKGDQFTLTIPAIKDNPERQETVIAIEDEVCHSFKYLGGPLLESPEERWYKIRQVRWEIPEVASGVAEMTENCEHPRWIFTGGFAL